MTRVRGNDVYVRQAIEVLQQACAVRMQFRRENFGVRIAPGEQRSLAAGRGATIKDPFSTTDQQRDQLRSFILNGDAAFLISARSGYVARKNASRRR